MERRCIIASRVNDLTIRMRCESDHAYSERKNMEGGDCGLYVGCTQTENKTEKNHDNSKSLFTGLVS